MVDIFISYSRTDQALVRRLAEAVKSEGYSVWWDDELPPHLSYGDVISAKIGEAKAAIVVWSEGAATSEWVRAEADVARNQKKLIQTSIDGRMPPMPFNQIQFAAIGHWQGETDHPGWMKVKASLVALCGPRAPTEAPPAALPPAAAPPPPAPAPVSGISYDPAKGARRSVLVPLLLGALLLLLLAVAYLLIFRGGESPAPAPAPANQAAPAPEPAKPDPAEDASVAKPEPEAPAPPPRAAAPAAPRPKSQAPSRAPPVDEEPAAAPPVRRTDSAPLNPRAVRRYCMGPGRNTAECRELRARYGR